MIKQEIKDEIVKLGIDNWLILESWLKPEGCRNRTSARRVVLLKPLEALIAGLALLLTRPFALPIARFVSYWPTVKLAPLSTRADFSSLLQRSPKR